MVAKATQLNAKAGRLTAPFNSNVSHIHMPDLLIWPAVALILGFVAMLLFKPAIDKKIAGITHATKDSVSFERPQEVIEQKPPLLSFVELMNEPVSASVLEREKTVKAQLKALKLKNDEEIAILTRVGVTTRVELEFNNISNTIFGSQLTLLIQLSSTHNGIEKQQAETIFKQAQITFPELHGDKTCDDWLKYLFSSNLIVSIDNKIDITQFGTDFLKYLVDARMTYNRNG